MRTGGAALLRIARREVRRHPRRSALVVALIAVPIAVVSCGLATQATIEPTDAELRVQEFGQADLVVGAPLPVDRRSGVAAPIDAPVIEAVGDSLPAGSQISPYRRLRADLVADDRGAGVVIIATDATDPTTQGIVRLDRGRLPDRSGEVALAPGLADELGVDVGDVVELSVGAARLEVVGFARSTGALRQPIALVPSSTVPITGWLVDLPPGTNANAIVAQLREHHTVDDLAVQTATDALRRAGIGPALGLDPTWFMVGVLALAWTGVIAAATFAIGARSRLREIGLVAVNGATRRQTSRMLLADGLVLGLTGSLIGLVVGLLVASSVVEIVARDADRAAGSLRVPVMAEIATVALGTGGALLAARWPATRAARLPTLAALQSRITRPPRRLRATLGGAAAMTAGAVVLGYGASTNAETPILLGTMLMVAGVAMLHRLLVDAVAALANRTPLALRFAARDASRQASRTGPAVVASMLALAAAIAAATILSTAQVRDAASPQLRGLLPAQTIEIGVRPADHSQDSEVAPLSEILGPLDHTIANQLDAQHVGAIWSATLPGPSRSDVDNPEPLQVATPAALRVLGVNASTVNAFEQGAAVRVDPDVVPTEFTLNSAAGHKQQVPVTDVQSGTVGVLGTFAVSPQVAERLGYSELTSASILVDLGRPHRPGDLAHAHATALRAIGPDYQIWTNSAGDCCTSSRAPFIAMALGLAIALPVLGLVAALIRSEARSELAVLDASGISPGRRRRFAASNVGLLATFAAILALPAGLMPSILYMRAGNRDVPGGSLISVPTAAIALAVVGTPVLLATIAWLVAGRPRPASLRL